MRKYLTLTDLKAHTTILASTSRTTLTQTFANPWGVLAEARYVFPLYDGVSVVGFTCTIGDRVIRGVVKERKEAKKTFDAAVERGETAALLEQSTQASDVFTTTLGNVPANTSVQVEITYLGELEHDAEVDGVRFTIPTAIAPRYGSGPSPSAMGVNGSISFTVDADMGKDCPIKSVQSPSHPISVSIGTLSTDESATPSLQRASAALSLNSTELEADFVVQIVAASVGNPVAMLETHPTMPNQRALMTSLVPRFNLPVEKPEVIFICDRSGSMSGKIPNLIAALQIFLKSLPVGVRFNICSFGSRYSFLWKKSQMYDQNSLDKAVAHVKTFNSDYGGTEMYKPVEEAFKRRYSNMNLEVFLLTDGEIWDQQQLFTLVQDEVKSSNGAIRVFSLGVGTGASTALINGVARAGNGFAQTTGENEKMDKKIVRMLKGALTPHVKDYTLEIKYEKADTIAERGNDNDEDNSDEEFELVEKVMDALTIGVANDDKPASAEQTTPVKPISLFDSNVSNDQMQLPDSDTKDMPKLPEIESPRYLQSPFNIPPLFPFIRTTVYVLFSDATPSQTPKSVILKGTSTQGPLELEIPITTLDSSGTMLHQLAARKAVQELEEGRGWIHHAKDAKANLLKDNYESTFQNMVEREAVRLGVKYQVGGKYCSFVAVQQNDDTQLGDGEADYQLGHEDIQALMADQYITADATMVYSSMPPVYSAGAKKRKGGGNPFASAVRGLAGSAARLSAPFQSFAAPPPGRYAAKPTPPPPPMARPLQMNLDGYRAPLAPGGPSMQQNAYYAPPPSSGHLMAQPTGAVRHRRIARMDSDEDALEEQDLQLEMCVDEIADPTASPYLSYDVDKKKTRGGGYGSTGAAGGAAPVDKVKELADLQTFMGSWRWSARLESVIGVTKQRAMSAISISAKGSGEDVVATLCVYVFLKVKMADEMGSWELMGDKALAWLEEQTGQTGGQLEQLVVEAKMF